MTPSGLEYIEYVVGTGSVVTVGDTVSVLYTGWLNDGTKLDSNMDNGRPVFEFVLGGGRVIAGFDEGVRQMRVGGLRRLIIPPHLAFGSRGGLAIPPNSTLIFDVKLVAKRGDQTGAARLSGANIDAADIRQPNRPLHPTAPRGGK
jgi:FKBP-type peptidyl-prolyl cis-trans isomerase